MRIFNYRTNVFDVFRLILNEYLELKKFFLIRNKYQLIGWERNGPKSIIMLRVCGTSNIFYSSPEKILEDDSFVNGLIGSDVRVITSLIKEEQKFSARYQLISQNVDIDTNEISFIIYDSIQKSKERRSLLSIQKDKILLENMSGRDGQIVGFMSAMTVESATQASIW